MESATVLQLHYVVDPLKVGECLCAILLEITTFSISAKIQNGSRKSEKSKFSEVLE